jgi:hypothetical protein
MRVQTAASSSTRKGGKIMARSDRTDEFLLTCGMLAGMMVQRDIRDYIEELGVNKQLTDSFHLFIAELYAKTLTDKGPVVSVVAGDGKGQLIPEANMVT